MITLRSSSRAVPAGSQTSRASINKTLTWDISAQFLLFSESVACGQRKEKCDRNYVPLNRQSPMALAPVDKLSIVVPKAISGELFREEFEEIFPL